MGRHYIKKLTGIVIMISLLSVLTVSAAAGGQPYEGYQYNSWNNSVSAPNSYYSDQVLNGEMLGTGSLKAPADLFCRNGEIYLVDSGNNRIIVMDPQYKVVRTISAFTDAEGLPATLNTPQGIFVREDGSLIIADTENKRILFCNADGTGARWITKPDADIYPASVEFRPLKVLEDSSGNLYVLVKDFTYGSIVFDPSGRFGGFYGANAVEVTAWLLANRFWKSLLTKTQISYLSNFVPVTYSGFDIDSKDFIYTCTLQTSTSLDEVKKINNVGINIFRDDTTLGTYNKNDFGDKERVSFFGQWVDTKFIDIDISDRYLINVLDQTQGRVFQYDEDLNLLGIFGGIGEQAGTFKRPIAIESLGEDIMVLDAEKNDLTIFKPTDYGETVQKADMLFTKGFYQDAVPLWEKVLKLNSNFEMAYVGMGKALAEDGKYKDALWYFRRGYDRESYSDAFSIVRADYVQQHFPIFGGIAVLLIAWFLFQKKILRFVRRRFSLPEPVRSQQTPLYVMLHPLEGFYEIRRSRRFTILAGSVLIVLFWFAVSIIQRQATGFIFNLNRPETLDITMMFMKTFGILLLFCICNRGVSTLLDGEGTLRGIWVVSSYAILPYAVSILAATILSNFSVYEEGALVNLLVTAGLLWSMFLLASGIKDVNQFSIPRTAASLLFTVLGMMLVLFIIVLFISLVQQFYTFIGTIVNEIMFRTA